MFIMPLTLPISLHFSIVGRGFWSKAWEGNHAHFQLNDIALLFSLGFFLGLISIHGEWYFKKSKSEMISRRNLRKRSSQIRQKYPPTQLRSLGNHTPLPKG